MKKLIASGLILSMLTSTGTICFAGTRNTKFGDDVYKDDSAIYERYEEDDDEEDDESFYKELGAENLVYPTDTSYGNIEEYRRFVISARSSANYIISMTISAKFSENGKYTPLRHVSLRDEPFHSLSKDDHTSMHLSSLIHPDLKYRISIYYYKQELDGSFSNLERSTITKSGRYLLSLANGDYNVSDGFIFTFIEGYKPI